MKCRISQFCSQNNICSRIDAKKFINLGMIKIKNSTIRSDIFIPEGFKPDNLKLIKRASDIRLNKISVLQHKPFGFMSTYTKNCTKLSKNLLTKENRSEEDTRTRLDPYRLTNLFPISPLEVFSSGLLIYSQDKILFTKYLDCEEEFEVVFTETPTPYKLSFLSGEVYLEGSPVGPVIVKNLRGNSYSITIKGSSTKLRKICLLAGLEIKTLKRIRFSNIKLGSLLPGEWRLLRSYEFS